MTVHKGYVGCKISDDPDAESPEVCPLEFVDTCEDCED
ncbi:hypothetical protein FTV88_1904 [Heliorestis convoluta]|uniref:Uncharacterized protein n=2 Tax=Heliorestis convoluta TaxID=356322 RepID=A0A5Q2N3X2_9FIRM|nr:hypothetical protein FTV88_1904 [Heliorestis convoluta]